MKGIYFGKRNEDIYEHHEKNGGLLVIYGAAFWGRMLAEEINVKIDFFCDRDAESICNVGNIPVVDSIQLEKLVRESKKRATIIICVGLNKSVVTSIYKDLIKLNFEADVFDYFDNLNVFNDKSFVFEKKKYALYEHPYNCGYIETRMTERSVEIAIAKEYLKICGNNVMEIGAVTPYYFFSDKIVDIVDPTDPHNRVNIKKSIFDCDLKGREVLSISTVEHVGMNEYGLTEEKNAVDAIQKIMSEAKRYLITAPLGYNDLLDSWLKNNSDKVEIKLMKRTLNNHWMEISINDFEDIKYTPLWACGLAVIKSNIELCID